MQQTIDKRSAYDVFLLIALYILTTANIFDRFLINEVTILIVKFAIKIGFILFMLFFTFKNKMAKPTFMRPKVRFLLFVPLVILTMSNFIYALVAKLTVTPLSWPPFLLEGVALNILIVATEEFLFRVLLLAFFLTITTKAKSVLYSSLFFGFIHIVAISTLATVLPVLAQVAYTFLLGLVTATIYLFTKNFIWPFLFHLLFNVINGALYGALYSSVPDVMFYVINVVIGVVAALYLVFVYLYLTKKEEEDYVTNIMDN